MQIEHILILLSLPLSPSFSRCFSLLPHSSSFPLLPLSCISSLSRSLSLSLPLPATTNLDAESKRAAHFRSSWQQHVNVFGSWSRPECVQQLHQEAELNLQSLLQDFEEHLYEHKITGQTFKHPSSLSSEDTSLSEPSGAASQKPDFIFLPTPSQVCESRTSPVGIWPQDPAIGPPVAEKPRWHLGSQDPVRLKPVDTTGTSGGL
ncbi:hypothetical protein Z043_112686 [Scleropages formosus]|uniref:NHS-like protein 1-like n=1 Tax=Scleropages formosus TaxID=113540 RepID=A0A0P7YLK8_SCLFO|nr:hypothetical protein Z043_112686 [Scleropages formosus]